MEKKESKNKPSESIIQFLETRKHIPRFIIANKLLALPHSLETFSSLTIRTPGVFHENRIEREKLNISIA